MPGTRSRPAPDASSCGSMNRDITRRFSEDPLLMLHLLRNSSVLNHPMEADVSNEIIRLSPLLKNVLPPALFYEDNDDKINLHRETQDPAEIFSEILQLLCGKGVGRVLRSFTDVFTLLFPPLLPTVGYHQHNPHHLYTVYEHTVRAVEMIPPDPVLRLTMLLHDTGKPLARTTDEKGIGHYAGHQRISAVLSEKTLRAWQCDPAFAEQVCILVEAHDIPLSTDPDLLKRRLRKFGEKNLRCLFLIHMADRIATGTRDPDHARAHCRELEEALEQLTKQNLQA